jgi:hypothetical protein
MNSLAMMIEPTRSAAEVLGSSFKVSAEDILALTVMVMINSGKPTDAEMTRSIELVTLLASELSSERIKAALQLRADLDD